MSGPIIKESQPRKGKAPIIRTLANYLEKEEGREASILLNSDGNTIDADKMVQEMGGPAGEHWHAILSPDPETCRVLAERHAGDLAAAAKELAAKLSRRLEGENRGRPVLVAIHLSNRNGERSFHLHLVGKGKPQTQLYGRNGAIQRAWDREFLSNQRPIVDWKAHASFLRTRADLRAVQKQLRDLGEERRRAISSAPVEQKQAVRESFTDRELVLISKRHELEVKAINFRYQSRDDLGSDRHLAELKGADARRSSALTRATFRGQPQEIVRGHLAAQRATGLAASITSRAAKKVGREASKVLTANTRMMPEQTHGKDHSLEKFAGIGATLAVTAAKTVLSKAVQTNIPGLAIKAASFALELPVKAMERASDGKRGRLPDELFLPLKTAAKIPLLGIGARAVTVVAESALPRNKEMER